MRVHVKSSIIFIRSKLYLRLVRLEGDDTLLTGCICAFPDGIPQEDYPRLFLELLPPFREVILQGASLHFLRPPLLSRAFRALLLVRILRSSRRVHFRIASGLPCCREMTLLASHHIPGESTNSIAIV